MKIKITVNGVTHTAEYTYTLTDKTKDTFNKLVAEAIKKEAKNESVGKCVCVCGGMCDGVWQAGAGWVGLVRQKAGGFNR